MVFTVSQLPKPVKFRADDLRFTPVAKSSESIDAASLLSFKSNAFECVECD